MYMCDITAIDIVVVRYSEVLIIDRREDRTWTENLYCVEFTSEVKDVTLNRDSVWKGIVEKFNRLGYDLDTPSDVTRIHKRLEPGWEWSYDFQRYDEEHNHAEPVEECEDA